MLFEGRGAELDAFAGVACSEGAGARRGDASGVCVGREEEDEQVSQSVSLDEVMGEVEISGDDEGLRGIREAASEANA
jgi:hypothetical protein